MAVTRSLKPNIKDTLLLTPTVISATHTHSIGVDTAGFDSLVLLFLVGAISAAGLVTLKLEECDTDVDGSYTDVAAADMDWGGATALAAAPVLTNTVQRVGYKGSKKWVRATITYVSGTSVQVAVVAIQGHPNLAPVV